METGGHIGELVAVGAALLFLSVATMIVTRKIRFPFPVALVVVGIVLAEAAAVGPAWLAPLSRYELSPTVVLFAFMPTLVFESAFNFDSRQLRQNILPVLTLAVPGVLVSTIVSGVVIWWATGIDVAAALLLGSILSATDTGAVTAILRQSGAPKRLVVLMEGESLFNDAIAIVLARVLVGALLVGGVTASAVSTSALDFLLVFFGGIAVGWAAALVTGEILGRIDNDPFIEITLTTVLAYVSFLIAEELFQVSGVMATVTAGLMMGGWGRTKISPEVAGYLDHFWDYMVWLVNALIFLMVGLHVDLGAVGGAFGLLAWGVVAMMVGRAAAIYGLVPLIGEFPGAEPVSRRYQSAMIWGGLRGGIALAIALSLTTVAYRELFVAVTTGAVLFSLLVQGLTVEDIVTWLKLDRPPLSDRFARVEAKLSAKSRSLERLPELQEGGLFSARIAESVQDRLARGLKSVQDELDGMRDRELDRDEELRLLFLNRFGSEKTLYYDMFAKGHLSERAYRDLAHSIDLQAESIRHRGTLPRYTIHPPREEQRGAAILRIWDRIPLLSWIAERMRTARTARDYEEVWGRHQGSSRVLRELASLARAGAIREDTIDTVQSYYERWNQAARRRLDMTAEQFPEFVAAMQERLAERLVLHAEREVIEAAVRAGTIPLAVAEPILEELASEIRQTRGRATGQLRVDPSELLRKVPFFHTLPAEEFSEVAARLKRRITPADQTIIEQGERTDSMYLIARGVVRVSRTLDGEEREVATLFAGDFFGEMALLHGARRTATCHSVTPCALYELRREDFDAVRAACPGIRESLEVVERERRHELAEMAARTAE